MPRGSVDLSPITGMAPAWSGSPDGEFLDGIQVWRVRFWLLALAGGLLAGHSHIDAAQPPAVRGAATQTGCLAPMAKAARKAASFAPPVLAQRPCSG